MKFIKNFVIVVVFILLLALIAGAIGRGVTGSWNPKDWVEHEHTYVDGKCTKCGQDAPAESNSTTYTKTYVFAAV